jgi:hypothetical protein
MNKNKKLGFWCFSPPVMLATFAIEITLLITMVCIKKLNATTRLAGAILFFLAAFQLAEYFVCGGLGASSTQWSRFGFIAITTLPPLGIHLIHNIAKKKAGLVVYGSYALMSLWIILFGFSERAFSGYECVSNYIIFSLQSNVGLYYGAYYYGILLLGIWMALQFARSVKQKKVKEALHGMVFGYLTFLLPTAIVNTISPETMVGIPSIMCGFAVLFALTLFFYVAPRVATKK